MSQIHLLLSEREKLSRSDKDDDDDDDDDDIVGARGLGAGSRADPAAAPPQAHCLPYSLPTS